jgi:DNA-binding response OmpR family regulator
LLHLLYVGRKAKPIADLQALLEQCNGTHSTTISLPVSVTVAANQRVALQVIRTTPPAMMLVEVEPPIDSRLRFCELVRHRLPSMTIYAVEQPHPQHPFAFDGWLDLPFTAEQITALLARVPEHSTDYLLRCGPLVLNLANRTVSTPKGEYTMTPKQCALLQMLMTRHGQVVSRGEIMELIWETSYLEDTRTLDVHIRWLRERIEPDPSSPIYLRTVRGIGYCLNLTN